MRNQLRAYRHFIYRLSDCLGWFTAALLLIITVSTEARDFTHVEDISARRGSELFFEVEERGEINPNSFCHERKIHTSLPTHPIPAKEDSDKEFEEESEEDYLDDDYTLAFRQRVVFDKYDHKVSYKQSTQERFFRHTFPLYVLFQSWRTHLI